MIGSLDAVNRYEETHGAQFWKRMRFKGYEAQCWMNCAVVIGCTRGVRQNMRKIENAMNELQQRLGRPPMETEVAKNFETL